LIVISVLHLYPPITDKQQWRYILANYWLSLVRHFLELTFAEECARPPAALSNMCCKTRFLIFS